MPVPVLDDRSYNQLVAELRGRIPAYTQEWTNQQESDPGVTLLELFAFLGENLLFRFNQIPDATKLWLLRMLQVPLLPARPSTGLVTLSQNSPSLDPPPQVYKGSTVRAGNIPFETLVDVVSLPVTARALAKLQAPTPTTPELVAAVERAIDARGGLAAGEEPQFYAPQTLKTSPTAVGVDSLQMSQSVDSTLWVAVIAADGVDAGKLRDAGSPLDGQDLNIGIWLTNQYPSMPEVDPCGGLTPPPPPGQATPAPTVNWQISVAHTGDDGNPAYMPVKLDSDSTAGLTTNGVAAIRLPAGLTSGGWPVGIVTPPSPDLAGAGDWPPVLDDNPAVVFWLRAYPASGAPAISDVSFVGVNAATVDQMQTTGLEFVGTGNGMAGQQLSLVNAGVDPASLVLQVQEQQVWVNWTRVDTLAGAGPNDRVYLLDAASGTITCGDTERGRAFPIGDTIRARTYRYGGGKAGNVAPGAISTIDGGVPVKVANPFAFSDGADAETIEHAMTRIPAKLSTHDRAVTATDFAQFASVQGVGRAECLPHFHPPTLDQQAAGVVTVVIWPTADLLHPEAPTPDRALLSAVCAELDPRRLVTTELYVVPPTYHQVAVSVGVHAQPGYSGNAVSNWVEQVLRQYLAPLPPLGPASGGWPLGRQVFGPELMAAALQVEGIDYLEPVQLGELDSNGNWQTVDPSQPIVLKPWEVVQLSSITVVPGTPLTPGQPIPGPSITPAPGTVGTPGGPGQPAPAPPTPTTLLPIPVPMEEC
jgi:Baseplate J-like protein